MILSSENISAARDIWVTIGEQMGVFAVGLVLGVVGVIRRKKISLKGAEVCPKAQPNT